jgi:plasmid maintenance system antidote protein VapI
MKMTFSPSMFTTPKGDEMVVLAKADYDKLVAVANARTEADEDADDIAIYDARKAGLAEDRDAPLPAEVSAALMRGDSLLKAVRQWRGMSQVELASAANITQGYLSDLENRKRTLSPDAAERVAAALQAPVEWLGMPNMTSSTP